MVLAMSRPWKHPKTGVYWLRKRVPTDLVELLGRDEVRKTLGTKDPEEAKRKFLLVLSETEAEWERLRAGPKVITQREAHGLARVVEQNWFAMHRENPVLQVWWLPEAFDRRLLFTGDVKPEPDADGQLKIGAFEVIRRSMRKQAVDTGRSMLEENGYQVDELSLLIAARAVAEALQRASLKLEREERGEFAEGDEPDVASSRKALPTDALKPSAATESPKTSSKPTITDTFDAWWKESGDLGLKISTYESYRNTFKNFVRFLKHDNLERLTRKDVVGFKDFRLQQPSDRTGKPVSPRTVKDSDLAALKAVFRWAVGNERMAVNPADGVTLKLVKKPKLRPKGFTDDEAKALLTAALNHTQGLEAAGTYAAKRWIPWLSAFTGARVGELVQLRKEDVTQTGDVFLIHITPEAWTVKTNEARTVPLHPQLIELGFTKFVAESAPGYLFLNAVPGGEVRGVWRGTKHRVAEFSRSVVTDPRVQPTHGWRHRFKTVGMKAGIETRILDVIQGHAPRSPSENYGDVELDVMAEAVGKLPRYEV